MFGHFRLGCSMACLAIAFCGPVQAQPATGLDKTVSHMNWNGVWSHVDTGGGPSGVFGRFGKNIPLTPEYAAILKKSLDAEKDGRYMYTPVINCIPGGLPWFMNAVYGLEVLMTPGQVTMISEALNVVRHIHADGRIHLADPDPTFAGDSVGHWEGDTLVVDTIGFRDDAVISGGLPGSRQMRVTERISLVDPDTLNDEMTLNDPKVLTGPWKETLVLKRANRPLAEFVCPAGSREHVNPDGTVITLPWVGK